eukprot:CAMPEP_0182457054 /NCGR_PEP_ID=MMETSP1319-20130603/2723_1 /TAXON_ID=172717 /ORGANISM="Bolidomonas pacifica, Strain RCC208" /LENGTH=485 /DNA_ID=CAMNT_0024655441 /DNA_START=23 /DNA_END=1480 /DNA_ORIENTATION=-
MRTSRSLVALLLVAASQQSFAVEMSVGWAGSTSAVGDNSAERLDMVCFPKNCGEADTTVHMVVKTEPHTSDRTTINTMSFPSSTMFSEYVLGDSRTCLKEDQGTNTLSTWGEAGYQPAIETFSQTFVGAGTGAYTEIGGPLFTSRTDLVRRPDLMVGGAHGLVATHDTEELSDNWDLEGELTPWGLTYSGPARFYQQFVMFDSDVTINLGDGADITLAPCDLLHLFNFVREEGNTEVATSADWKFRQPNGFSQAEFVMTGAVAVRQVSPSTIAVEVEKQHFLDMTGATDTSLPEYHHEATGKTYVRMYEWKSTVFCKANAAVDDINFEALTPVWDAEFEAALETYVDEQEVIDRGLEGWTHTEPASGDRPEYTLEFYNIPRDQEPLTYRTDESRHQFDHIHLNLRWKNLPPVSECPTLVWDPTFHALPASSDRTVGLDGVLHCAKDEDCPAHQKCDLQDKRRNLKDAKRRKLFGGMATWGVCVDA